MANWLQVGQQQKQQWVAEAPRAPAVVANVVTVVAVAVAAATTMGCTRKRNVNVNVAPGCAK